MKHVSFIFAVYILLMTAVPLFIKDDCMLHAQDTTACESAGHFEESGCTCCSPFMKCATCHGFIVPAMTDCPGFTEVCRGELVVVYSHEALPGFYSPIWEPPQVC
ncbi:hypothetical protein [Limibacterium fermenti]|uniref:hypothetical protein n=1 Tax=Limibacterium fermenti TaxID=3229863 RepID=UPI003A7A30B0